MYSAEIDQQMMLVMKILINVQVELINDLHDVLRNDQLGISVNIFLHTQHRQIIQAHLIAVMVFLKVQALLLVQVLQVHLQIRVELLALALLGAKRQEIVKLLLIIDEMLLRLQLKRLANQYSLQILIDKDILHQLELVIQKKIDLARLRRDMEVHVAREG
jgi:hypothetical protein